MENIKKIWRKHKKKIILGGCVLGGVVIGALIKGQSKQACEQCAKYAGKDVLSWVPNKESMKLERVKEILDANANNSSQFAIFREGPDPNAYICIVTEAKDFVYK